MVGKIKKIILKNIKSFGIKDLPVDDISKIKISKYFHASDSPRSKVIFFFTYNKKIKGIVKIVREKMYNDKLERECAGQVWAYDNLKNFFAPRVYFKDKIDGYFIYGEEVIDGEVLGRDDANQHIKKVFAYQNSIPKQKSIKTEEVSNIFQKININNNSYMALFEELAKYHGQDIYLAQAHGDLTYMNIIRTADNKFYLIDWERFDERNIWGIDFCHYFVRCFSIKNSKDFKKYLEEFANKNNFNLDIDYLIRAYLIDKTLDLLDKNYKEQYNRIVQDFKYIFSL